MKANELRIGNLIQIELELGEREIAKVEELTLETGESNNQYYFLETNLLSNNSKWVDPIDFFEPIPLTEEWLLKFGFEEQEHDFVSRYFGNDERIFLNKDNSHFNIFYKQDNTDETIEVILLSIQLKNVHQLQNLYFALTGEELTISE